jgi:pyruvyltransferase
MWYKKIPRQLKYRRRNAIYWARGEVRNWGDDLNPWLFKKIAGRNAVYCPHSNVGRLLMVGSILQDAGPLDDCWGTGFISSKLHKPPKLRVAHAIRGPLSRTILEQAGIEASYVYGDPALLVSKYVCVATDKKHSIGVIPHYIDLNMGIELCKEISAELIPVSLGIEDFVLKVSQSELIISSSLHGLICAESLGIPAIWARFSDNLLGGDFKFEDYIAGTERSFKSVKVLDLRNDTASKKLAGSEFCLPLFDVGAVIRKLISSFPLPLE